MTSKKIALLAASLLSVLGVLWIIVFAAKVKREQDQDFEDTIREANAAVAQFRARVDAGALGGAESK